MSNSNKIKVAIVGVGNCCSSLVQGLQYYKDKDNVIGLMHEEICGYKISDIQIVAAFDIDRRKIGKDLSEAIFEQPNCTKKFCDVPFLSVEVLKVCPFDGVAKHMEDQFLIDNNQRELNFDQIVDMLKKNKVDVLINYLPVGTQIGTDYWTDVGLSAGCAFINCIPVFEASNNGIAQKFKNAGLPVIGDDVKSQVGSTICSRYITQMLIDRGAKIDSIYQTNIGGNTDFRNMLDPMRLTSKKISKTESISSLISGYSNNLDQKPYIYAGPNGCIDSLNDNKISYMRFDFRIFGDISCSIDCKLSVEDSPDSAGVVVDSIRVAKLALDRKIGGPILPACAYFMKHSPIQMKDEDARKQLEEFIRG